MNGYSTLTCGRANISLFAMRIQILLEILLYIYIYMKSTDRLARFSKFEISSKLANSN